MNLKKDTVKVSDMYCSSCETRIEKEIKKIAGIKNVMASYERSCVHVEYDSDECSINDIKQAIIKAGYSIGTTNMTTIAGILIIGAAILLLGNYTGTFNMQEKLQSNVTYLVLFVVGIFTSIHCVGMCGGIMLSQSIPKENSSKFSSLIPSLQYNLGRLISYSILGGIVGAIGSVLSISLKVKAGIAIFAGLFMIIMGLNMAGFNVLRKLRIKLPWSACSIKKKSRAPFIVGLLNGLMPCGPLQTMQLFALGTGSALKGAISMFVFALGTIPLMLLFGVMTSFLSKGFTKQILKMSGVLVVVLGLIMSNRGLALAGVNLKSKLPLGSLSAAQTFAAPGAKAEIQNGVQILKMTADSSGYTPNVLFVQKGMPVKWIIEGNQITSCNNQIVIPSLNIQKTLSSGENVITFTPTGSDISFSCWMGMINGIIKVVDNLNSFDTSKANVTPPPSSSGGCCGGGGIGSQKTSIYGNDISKVPSDRLVKKAKIKGKEQTFTIKGIGYEFDPLIVVVQKDLKAYFKFDLTSYDNPEAEYKLIDGKTGETLTAFEGAAGFNPMSYTFKEDGAYGIVKDGNIVDMIYVVDDLKNADINLIRKQYLN